MRVAVLFGPLCLSFRGSFDFSTIRTDPRGLTGSEYGFVRIAECLREQGHDVTIYTRSTLWDSEQPLGYHEILVGGLRLRVLPLEALGSDGREFDAAIAINEPDLLRNINAKVKVCEAWLNDWTFAKPDFERHVDLFVSPSHGHLEQVLTNPEWRTVGVNKATPKGGAVYIPDPAMWQVIELGCDPERYDLNLPKVPGRVVYCSSPDRGLHLLLQEWPRIKRAVPHANLRIFYRLRPWIDGFTKVPYHPPIEGLRARALYIEEALRRMQGPEWGIEVHDSVSREQIEREMTEAECLAYPCSTTRWSEGFSCTILEACAARACPVITNCDGLESVYRDHTVMAIREKSPDWPSNWGKGVIRVLTDPVFRDCLNAGASAFASKLTWRHHTERLERAILDRLQKEPETCAHHPV